MRSPTNSLYQIPDINKKLSSVSSNRCGWVALTLTMPSSYCSDLHVFGTATTRMERPRFGASSALGRYRAKYPQKEGK